jgi:hypothetical protein
MILLLERQGMKMRSYRSCLRIWSKAGFGEHNCESVVMAVNVDSERKGYKNTEDRIHEVHEMHSWIQLIRP